MFRQLLIISSDRDLTGSHSSPTFAPFCPVSPVVPASPFPPCIKKEDKHTMHSLKGKGYGPGDSIILHLHCAFNHQKQLENQQMILVMQPALWWDRQ